MIILGKSPSKTGKVQRTGDEENQDLGNAALWPVDSENEDAPELSGSIDLNADRFRELLENNQDASEISVRIALWDNTD